MLNLLLFETATFARVMFPLYFITLIACFITSLFVFKYAQGLKVFPLLMGITVIIESISYVLGHVYIINPFGFYHYSFPIYGILMIYFFYHSIANNAFKKALIIIAVTYVCSSLSLTFFFYRLTDFPGLSYNMLGVILIAMSLYVLLTLEPVHNIPLYKHPLAWFCIGMIVFYTGTFFLNGIYNYLVVTKSKSRILIHAIINNGLNCFMYSCFIVGLICSHRLKKYEQPTVPRNKILLS